MCNVNQIMSLDHQNKLNGEELLKIEITVEHHVMRIRAIVKYFTDHNINIGPCIT